MTAGSGDFPVPGLVRIFKLQTERGSVTRSHFAGQGAFKCAGILRSLDISAAHRATLEKEMDFESPPWSSAKMRPFVRYQFRVESTPAEPSILRHHWTERRNDVRCL